MLKNLRLSTWAAAALMAGSGILSACQATATSPVQTATHVDLPSFMGDWYVIANIPTFIERDAYGAVESYRLDGDGTIDTTFTFRKGGFDGKTRRYKPRGFVYDHESNAIWGMRFVWPIKADYRILQVTPDYQRTVIGRDKRDYAWIMARTPSISDADYAELLDLLRTQGYDISKVRKVPQQSKP
ncbi:MAG: lipocalin family protein [Pseudomonadota bacterium]|nr:lipocalin family protein [Pseudomonadota bacterium]